MKRIILALGLTTALFGNPREATVLSGLANFSEPSPGVLEIQTGNIAIINWVEFSIGAGETTRFLQPSALSAVLNRVSGGNPSELQGQLFANGSIYLLNPNGVFISKDAIIETNNFMATTFEIADSDFLSHDFTKGLFYVPPAVQPHDHPFAAAIRHEGQFSALSVEEHGGHFYLLADRVDLSGSVETSSGAVRIIADRILLSDTARIDVSGPSGGRIEIGGGPHGQDATIPNAGQVAITSGATLLANATEQGDGGEVVIWSQDGTWFHGAIEAKGGPSGGNGGWIEVSGKHYLDYQGIANTTAPCGSVGTLLLDPINIAVTGADSMITAAPLFRPTGSPSTIAAASIIGGLAGSNIIVESSGAPGAENGDITISAAISYMEANDLTFRTANLSTSPAVPSGNININADVTNAGTGSIFFDASGSINQTAATVSTMGTGNLTYTALGDLNLTAVGATSAEARLISGTGVITVEVGNDLVLTGSSMGGDARIQTQLFPIPLGSVVLDVGGDCKLIPAFPGGATSIGAGVGLTIDVGGDLEMNIADLNAGCSIDLREGTEIINIGGNVTMSGSAFIDSSTDPGSSTINIGGNLSMFDSANMAHGLDDGLMIDVGGDLTMIGDSFITGTFASGGIFISVGGNFYGNGEGDIDIGGPSTFLTLQVGGTIELIDDFFFSAFSDSPVSVSAGGDFIIDGTPGMDCGFSQNNDSPTTILVGGNFIMQNGALYDNVDNGALTIRAGGSLKFLDTSRVLFGGAADVTLICDNAFSSPPEFGSSQFVKASGATIDTSGGLLLIYTADRSQNVVQGLLNGVPFVPGPEFVNSATEMWGIYAPHNSGIPFTIFYKNIFFPTSTLTAFDVSYYDFLQNISRFDRFYFVLKRFSADEGATMIQPLFWPNNPLWFAPSLYLE